MLGHGGGEIIEPQFARATTERLEGMHVAAHEGFETLLWVNSRYILRLWHSTRQKAYSLRGVPL